MRHLPSLSALQVLEAAARTGSYAEAARALGLTHGAVSRQVAVLEDWLGQRLFVRTGRRMVPTEAARAFAGEVSRALDRVSAAAEACGRPSVSRVLRVSAPTTFAMRWLIPRLSGFEALRPEVVVQVSTVTTLHDELRGGFDVAIRRAPDGQGTWPQHRATRFLSEFDVVVASPGFLRRHPVHHPRDVAALPRLSTETRPRDWTDWLLLAGLPDPGAPRRVFDHFFVTLQAAADGLGLAIGPLPVLSAAIADGHLAAPLPELRVPRPGYHALVPFDADKGASLSAFVDWLVAEGRPGADSRERSPRTPPPRSS